MAFYQQNPQQFHQQQQQQIPFPTESDSHQQQQQQQQQQPPPQHQHQPQPQPQPQHQFLMNGPRTFHQGQGHQGQQGQQGASPGQSSPPIGNPNFFPQQRPQQQQQQQQPRGFPGPHPQLIQRQPGAPHQQPVQFAGYGGNDMSTSLSTGPQSSNGPMSMMNMNAAAAAAAATAVPANMQPGQTQQQAPTRPSQQQQQQQQQHPGQIQPHHRNNSQQMSPFNQNFPADNFNASTPPISAAGKSFLSQATPSPTKTSNPNGLPHSQQIHPSIGGPMAASPQNPAAGLPGQQQKPQATPPQRPVINPPLSPEDAKRETQRVNVLLSINTQLLQAIVHLQQIGRTGPLTKPPEQNSIAAGTGGGQSSPTVSESGEKDADGGEKKKQQSSREFVECMRRVQANLAYLAAIADRAHKPPERIPARPAIMDTLPSIPGNHMPEKVLVELKELYRGLKELYPSVSVGPSGTGAGNFGGQATTTGTSGSMAAPAPVGSQAGRSAPGQMSAGAGVGSGYQ